MHKWGVHIDHPWSECVRQDGAPLRIYIRTPWNSWIIALAPGNKSQVFDRKTNTWTDRWAFITSTPNDHLTRTKKK